MPDLSQAKLHQVVTVGGLEFPIRYGDGLAKGRSGHDAKTLLFTGIGLSIMV
jgi:hypothetical protein